MIKKTRFHPPVIQQTGHYDPVVFRRKYNICFTGEAQAVRLLLLPFGQPPVPKLPVSGDHPMITCIFRILHGVVPFQKGMPHVQPLVVAGVFAPAESGTDMLLIPGVSLSDPCDMGCFLLSHFSFAKPVSPWRR